MARFNIMQMMNEKSKSEAEPGKETFDVVLLPLDCLIPSKDNKYGIRDIETLAASIETVGLLHNLVVKKTDTTGKYTIISGERRCEALKLLVSQGKKQYNLAPCKIEGAEEENPEINELRLLFANATARDLTDYERTYQAQRIKELLLSLKKKGYKFQGRMRELVAEMMDMSPAQVGRMESINENLSPGFKEEFKSGKIGVTAAYELSRLPEEQQAQEMEAFHQTGAVEVKDIQAKREQVKPQPPTGTPDKPKGTAFDGNKCDLVSGTYCSNGVTMKKHFMKGGNLTGCAGCCAMCSEAGKCEYVCDPYKQAHPAPQPSAPAVSAKHSMPVHDEVILKPCPFCGAKAEKLPGEPGISIVRCPACDIRVYRKSDNEAVAAWNRRV